MAHKAEHAVDMHTGAVVAVTLQEAHLGDTTTVKETLTEAGTTVVGLIEWEAEAGPSGRTICRTSPRAAIASFYASDNNFCRCVSAVESPCIHGLSAL